MYFYNNIVNWTYGLVKKFSLFLDVIEINSSRIDDISPHLF